MEGHGQDSRNHLLEFVRTKSTPNRELEKISFVRHIHNKGNLSCKTKHGKCPEFMDAASAACRLVCTVNKPEMVAREAPDAMLPFARALRELAPLHPVAGRCGATCGATCGKACKDAHFLAIVAVLARDDWDSARLLATHLTRVEIDRRAQHHFEFTARVKKGVAALAAADVAALTAEEGNDPMPAPDDGDENKAPC